MVTVFAKKKWRYYLLGHHFIIRMDQKSLKYLMDQGLLEEDQQKWIIKLLEFDFEIQYQPRQVNSVANTLSKQGELSVVSVVQALIQMVLRRRSRLIVNYRS